MEYELPRKFQACDVKYGGMELTLLIWKEDYLYVH